MNGQMFHVKHCEYIDAFRHADNAMRNQVCVKYSNLKCGQSTGALLKLVK